jgi:hypothetical protein
LYNEGLRQRGDVTIWLSPEVEEKWLADKRQTPGGLTYSDMAISVCLTLGMVFKQLLRVSSSYWLQAAMGLTGLFHPAFSSHVMSSQML